ncbi:Rrf2 family transcriptional regulator [Nocardia panacis]|uniref:Rrf2 family transcriptional regulator n=1 Tax=Nocardia panacis TaxID=2340916 RepID=A0A3A4K6E2_9NOCA|nr:Rrf2 family transcriptional regulator [Nocardia panacis]RJO70050.1 Rrf2 family transcriptional regulator [Nocardia panacis]
MRMGEGVEWGIHCCMTIGQLERIGESPVSTARLAERFGLPQQYLKKRLQALVRAGILASVPGAAGGFDLARRPEQITLMDVVAAVEGVEYAFRCAEIRQHGVDATKGRFARPCGVSVAMRRAELAWRRELARQTIADLMAAAPPEPKRS